MNKTELSELSGPELLSELYTAEQYFGQVWREVLTRMPYYQIRKQNVDPIECEAILRRKQFRVVNGYNGREVVLTEDDFADFV